MNHNKNEKITSGKNILFLYAEITPYFLGCIDSYSKSNPKNNILVIFNSVFKNLEIVLNNNVKLVPKNKFKKRTDFVKSIYHYKPSIILVSGRMDKDYLFISKLLKKNIKIISLQDTMYQRNVKQLIQSIFSKYLYMQYFDRFWGIGSMQTKFAKRIGFSSNDIYEGFYVADKIFFKNNIEINYNNIKQINFLFIGRLVKEKNIIKLAKALDIVNSQIKTAHKLIIIGAGEYLSKVSAFKCVDYKGFKSQNEIINIAKKCHVFCLPSTYEPWGVVTHEMAALGLPVLSSNKCGSSHDLVIDGFNGFKFNPLEVNSIVMCLKKFILLSAEEKRKFSQNSFRIASKINHENWNNTLNSIILKP